MAQGLPAQASSIAPSVATVNLNAGQAVNVTKMITLETTKPVIDLCYLADETASAAAPGNRLSAANAGLLASTLQGTNEVQFATSGYRDYPGADGGPLSDFAYRNVTPATPSAATWLTGVTNLTTAGGGGAAEAQFDAIVGSIKGIPGQLSCGFRTGADLRVLLVHADSPFHVPPAPYLNNLAAVQALATLEKVTVIGIGTGADLASVSSTVLPNSANGTDIATAITAALPPKSVTVGLSYQSSVPGLTVSFTPAFAGSNVVTFNPQGVPNTTAQLVETFTTTAAAKPGTYHCIDIVTANGAPAMSTDPATVHGAGLLYQDKVITIMITIRDPATTSGHNVTRARRPAGSSDSNHNVTTRAGGCAVDPLLAEVPHTARFLEAERGNHRGCSLLVT